MLISVSGKINSGKDLIGEIILYLTDKYYHSKAGEKASFENWKTSNIHSSGYNISHKAMYEANNTNHFKIKKFATIPTEIYKKITNIDFHSLSRTEKELVRPNFIDFINNKVKQVFGKDVWVKALMREYFCTHSDHAPHGIGCPNWCITDMRFLNEMEAVKKKGGITIRVNRNLEESKDQHESETELDNAEFDYVIDNGTIEELIEKVREILTKEKLL